ncbi:MAG TPA: T9SS type A sorting domain-containing protein [Paludibacteraceae bacterium]|jgi:hypothetical protein|nr:T9SS type A sorting domain-containing protein [Paludibacteraceae bacterium]HOH71813.1 T9SS type A sorting domain-containing protein [Paludibacteraceae bacterium]HQC04164.1 T9SS type A sorting domain-containing protein [Paludibacteraceae bacterium]
MKKFYLFLIGCMLCGVINAQDAPPAGTPVIKLTTTTAGATVRIDMRAAAANTPVWIETAPNTYTPVTVGTSWTDFTNYTPTGTSLKVYGNLIGFDCSGASTVNKNPISALDASGNTNLQLLYCYNNRLTSLNVQGLTQLNTLYCYGNELTSLNLQGLTQLRILWCFNNQLISLDVQGLTKLVELSCYNNSCTNTTLGLDLHYCQLPQRQLADDAKIYVSEKNQANLEAFVLATNGVNANSKNWKIYSGTYPNYYEITNTTGTYVCETGIEAVKSTVSIYPNPASNNITVETEAFGSTITITDLLGRTVMTATATATKITLNISSLTAGTYVVRVGDRMAKVVKM